MKYALFAAGLVIGACGVVIAFVETSIPFSHIVGIALGLAGVYLIQLSKRNIKAPAQSSQMHDVACLGKPPKRLNIMIWFMIGASVIAASVFVLCMVYYNYLWAVYGFIASMGVLAVLVAYVVGLTVWRIFNR